MGSPIYRAAFGSAWATWQLLRGRPERAYVREMEEAQYLSRDALQALQWNRLQRLLKHAYASVPFYRERFDRAGVHPDRVRGWDDFRQLPELTKTDVRSRLTDLVSTVPQRGLERKTTSGSTGVPLEFFLDERYRTYWEAARVRSQRWYGLVRGDKLAILAGWDRDMPRWTWRERTLATLERQRWFNVFDLSEDRVRGFALELERWGPEFIHGYPSGLHALARVTARAGIRIRPRAVQSHAEQLWDFQRTEVEAAFQCPVIDTYGARESAPIATQCLVRDGLHVMADLRVIEILDEGGHPVLPGRVGRVVLTDLTNYAMPLIRYANEDLASWADDTPCPCGRTLPRLAAVHGRSSDVIRTKTGMQIHGYFFMFLFYGVRGVERFQVRQTSLERIEILIQPNSEFREDLIAELHRRIDAQTGGALAIECRLVDDIPTTAAGKYRFTMSDVAADRSDA